MLSLFLIWQVQRCAILLNVPPTNQVYQYLARTVQFFQKACLFNNIAQLLLSEYLTALDAVFIAR